MIDRCIINMIDESEYYYYLLFSIVFEALSVLYFMMMTMIYVVSKTDVYG